MNKRQLKEDFVEEKYYDEDEPNKVENTSSKDDEIDPLDLYMVEMEQLYKKDLSKTGTAKQCEEVYENEDPIESQMDSIKKSLIKQHKSQKKGQAQANPDASDSDSLPFIDSDGELDFEQLATQKKKNIEPLPPIDHSQIQYEEFERNFYNEHDEISSLPASQVDKIRKEYQIHVKGQDVPKPIISFAHLNFDSKLIDKIVAQNFEKPTAIQSQALPCVLSGRNVIGVAKTGSGKTVAYAWPMLIHISAQRAVEKKEGMIGLVVVPTRELGQQVFLQMKKYAQLFNISVAALLGGENKHFQWKELRQGIDIVVATPGRLIEMIKKKATNMKRCTYVVLDEADQMFSLGFEYQVRSILGQIRPDRQIMLFTATMKKKVRQLCVDMLENPVVITVGENENQVNEDIKQIPVILENEEVKLRWLVNSIGGFLNRGKVLIFVNQIGQCDAILSELKIKLGIFGISLHGDKLQQERTHIINQFRTKSQLMVATDIASRGLDIKEIRTVVNFYPPKDADVYVHRIGRTGRAGNCDGEAYTVLLKDDWKLAILLIKNLELAGQAVPSELEDIACLDNRFRMERLKKRMGFQYAKGKDASKMLQQALKRSRNSKAGLGYDESEPKKQKKISKEQEEIIKVQKQQFQKQNVITSVANPLAQPTKFIGQFTNKWEEVNPYEHYQNYAAQVQQNENNRDAVIKHYQGEMKNKFFSNFKSAGSTTSSQQGPTVRFATEKGEVQKDGKDLKK